MTDLSRPASVSKELYKQLQHQCIDRDLTVREGLEEAIRLFLARAQSPSARRRG